MKLIGVEGAQVKFGFSAVRECLRAMEVFLNPSHHAEQMPWVRDARRRVSRELRRSVEDLRFFLEPSVESFAFSWIDGRQHTLESELKTLRAGKARYVDAVVKRLNGARLFRPEELERMRRSRWYRPAAAQYERSHPEASAALNGFVESPSQSLHSFCDVIAAFYEDAIAHQWGSINQRLIDDVAMRRRILKERGAPAMLRTLTPALQIHTGGRGSVVLDLFGSNSEVTLTERSVLLLAPSFFCWPHTQAFFLKTPDGPRCIVTYPLPPLPARSRRLKNAGALVEALEALGDPVRLQMAELLWERHLSTRELAGFLDVSEPVISRHLRKLLQCGLVARERSGYFVLYRLEQAAMKRVAENLSALSQWPALR